MKITVLGTGYVGLVSGVCLASKGHDVTCLDLRSEIVEQLNRGEPHIHEAGLPELLRQAIAAGNFRAALPAPEKMAGSEIILVAVGTPTVDGRIDLSHIENAARAIGQFLRTATGFYSVIIKSTVLPGTTDMVVRTILERESGKRLGDFGLGMNPEFLREGQAVEDFLFPDRIVFGHEDPRTLAALQKLYAPWDCDKLATNSRTAEMIKYANNCLLATQISAINELANIAAAIGDVDIAGVVKGVQLDKRWNPIENGRRVQPGILAYLKPGCGFGGSCFPKDVQAMRARAVDAGMQPELLAAVLSVNAQQPLQVPRLLETTLGALRGRRILLLGLAFKPGTDDVRESASLRIVRELCAAGANVIAHDPIAEENAKRELSGLPVEFVRDWESEIDRCEAVALTTVWPEYDRLATPSLTKALAGKVFVDARGRFVPSEFPPAVRYLTIGFRPTHAS
jgi:UDPglucose 6-dehydrogenase/GDP-mannose 6-dehydrogenase